MLTSKNFNGNKAVLLKFLHRTSFLPSQISYGHIFFTTYTQFLYNSKKHNPIGLCFICLATSYSRRRNPPTTISAKELNARVRHGNGCDLFAIATKTCPPHSSDRNINHLTTSNFFQTFLKPHLPFQSSSFKPPLLKVGVCRTVSDVL